MNILKKIKVLFLIIVFSAGCTIIMYESPNRQARQVWSEYWQRYSYMIYWGGLSWQCSRYYQVIYKGKTSRNVISKSQLQDSKSTKSVSNKKIVKTKEGASGISVKKEVSKKVIKKKK